MIEEKSKREEIRLYILLISTCKVHQPPVPGGGAVGGVSICFNLIVTSQ
jgi:hypothetical protein